MVMVESTREIGDRRTCEKRFYISSMTPDSRAANVIGSHWGIENELHGCLDVTFNEEGCRVRTVNAAENFNVVRKIAMHLLKLTTSRKLTVAKKRQLAGLNDRYLAEILGL